MNRHVFGSLVLGALLAAAPWMRTTAGAQHPHAVQGGGQAHPHSHHRMADGIREVAPRMSLALRATPGGGFDAVMSTANFRFARAHADGPHVYGEGHAHLYVDGKKIRRVYQPRTHIEPLGDGVHEIKLGLFTNDHAAYAAEGIPVAERYVVKVPQRERGKIRDIVVTLTGGKITSDNSTTRVEEGDMVQLRWRSDERLAVHLHGYDIEAVVRPRSPVTMRFRATVTGRFPIAVHAQAAGDHAHGHHALAYLEVHPR